MKTNGKFVGLVFYFEFSYSSISIGPPDARDENLTSALPSFSIALVVYTSPSNSNLTGLWAQLFMTTPTIPSPGSCLNSVWWVSLPFGNKVATWDNYINLIAMDFINLLN